MWRSVHLYCMMFFEYHLHGMTQPPGNRWMRSGNNKGGGLIEVIMTLQPLWKKWVKFWMIMAQTLHKFTFDIWFSYMKEWNCTDLLLSFRWWHFAMRVTCIVLEWYGLIFFYGPWSKCAAAFRCNHLVPVSCRRPSKGDAAPLWVNEPARSPKKISNQNTVIQNTYRNMIKLGIERNPDRCLACSGTPEQVMREWLWFLWLRNSDKFGNNFCHAIEQRHANWPRTYQTTDCSYSIIKILQMTGLSQSGNYTIT